nr:uncharacterized protein LOC110139686 [Odocoileus virginianus texanus]XP_020753348.1 uncharacterized protein LOC110139686 [Odocoileus virginianus texanus]XP_020753358.1 uncharacterized protein LOC110139686 [Odocoileus virginianus texanus]
MTCVPLRTQVQHHEQLHEAPEHRRTRVRGREDKRRQETREPESTERPRQTPEWKLQFVQEMGLFRTQESNLCLLHCTWTLYHLRHQGSHEGKKDITWGKKDKSNFQEKLESARMDQLESVPILTTFRHEETGNPQPRWLLSLWGKKLPDPVAGGAEGGPRGRCPASKRGRGENQRKSQMTAEPSFPFATELIHRLFHEKLCFQWVIIRIEYYLPGPM